LGGGGIQRTSRKSENPAFVVDGDILALGGKHLYTFEGGESTIHVIHGRCYSGAGEEQGRSDEVVKPVGYLQP